VVFRYGNKVRSEASRRTLAGERVEEVAGELGVSQATRYRWKRQGLIDAGRKPGVKSYEPNELERARQRIKDLESELELVKTAAALFNGEEVLRPKGSGQSPRG
jgi:transposase-like protein